MKIVSPVELDPAGGDMTGALQCAIEEAAAKDGVLLLKKGRYRCGGLTLRGNLHIVLEQGCILLGSKDCLQYGSHQWFNAIFYAEDEKNICISGEGVIDGNDCVDPEGEEGFRGPHAICFRKCENICIEGITIRSASNYAVLCTNSHKIDISNITVEGGHDGLHLQACTQIQVLKCVLSTGDDAVAGSDNRCAVFSDCVINSSCNGFRFGGAEVTVQNCHIFGPGKYSHKISGRKNMISAFTYFSPKERECTEYGDNWLIQNVTVEGADCLFCYDHECGIWQNGLPLRSIRFENIHAEGLLSPFQLIGDRDKLLHVEVEDMFLGFRGQFHIQEVIQISKIDSVRIHDLQVKCSEEPVKIKKGINQIKRSERYA